MKRKSYLLTAILFLSLSLNIILIIFSAYSETHWKVYSNALRRSNILPFKEESLADFPTRQGWTNTIKKLNTSFDVTFFGDSETLYGDFQTLFPDVTCLNLGCGGNTSQDMMQRISMLKASDPKKVFLMVGTNDLLVSNLKVFSTNAEHLFDMITDSLPNAKIYIESIIPMNKELRPNAIDDSKIRKANDILKDLSDKKHFQFIDIYHEYSVDGVLPKEYTKDGLHLLPFAYSKWGEKIAPYIYE